MAACARATIGLGAGCLISIYSHWQVAAGILIMMFVNNIEQDLKHIRMTWYVVGMSSKNTIDCIFKHVGHVWKKST